MCLKVFAFSLISVCRRPREAQDSSKTAPRAPKRAPRGPKRAPRDRNTRPRDAQGDPRAAQGGTKTAPRGPQQSPKSLPTRCYIAAKSQLLPRSYFKTNLTQLGPNLAQLEPLLGPSGAQNMQYVLKLFNIFRYSLFSADEA